VRDLRDLAALCDFGGGGGRRPRGDIDGARLDNVDGDDDLERDRDGDGDDDDPADDGDDERDDSDDDDSDTVRLCLPCLLCWPCRQRGDVYPDAV